VKSVKWDKAADARLSGVPAIRRADIDAASNKVVAEIFHSRGVVWLIAGTFSARLLPDDMWYTAMCMVLGAVWIVLSIMREKR